MQSLRRRDALRSFKLAAVGLAALAVSCGDAAAKPGSTAGSASTGATDTGAGIALDEFCVSLEIMTWCDALIRCRPENPLSEDLLMACYSGVVDSCEVRFGGAAYRDGRITWDPVGAADYVAEAKQAVRDCGDIPLLVGPGVGVGQGALGADCSAVGTDISGYYSCGAGLTCNLLASSKCVAAASLGQSCVALPCHYELGEECVDEICVAATFASFQ